MMRETTAVIMAGGFGTRIASVYADIPKPLIPIAGKPVLQHNIEALAEQGYRRFVLVLCHMADKIINYFGDGYDFGVEIKYFVEKSPLGTAGALPYVKEMVSDDFLLLNGDAIINIDFGRFEEYHRLRGGMATIFTHPNSHPYDSALIEVDENMTVTRWVEKGKAGSEYFNRVNAGVHIINKRVVSDLKQGRRADLDRDVLAPLIRDGKLFAYDSTEYVRDMGTPERLKAVENDVIMGVTEARNLKNKQKAIFLDRDGTINVYRNFITKPDELELIPGTAEAVRRINNSAYLTIIITNQPVIARGECSEEGLILIHKRLQTLLGNLGAFYDDLFYCPHHPDRGFAGEVPELKIDCECRKPKPGLLYKAAEKYNIDLKESFMIGDSERDIKAGINAGCRPILIGEGIAGISCPVYKDLAGAINHIL